jgi:hypothetical protein
MYTGTLKSEIWTFHSMTVPLRRAIPAVPGRRSTTVTACDPHRFRRAIHLRARLNNLMEKERPVL